MANKPAGGKFTITQMKRKLKELPKEEVIELFIEAAKSHKELLSFAAAKLQGEDAMSQWLKIPEPIRQKLIHNVWCAECSNGTSIENFSVQPDKHGIVLQGSCSKCGHKVARLIEKG
jgi:hypothetical protein